MASESAVARDTRTPSWWRSPVLIVVVAALIRGVLLLTYEGTIQDGITRVATAANWLFNGIGIFGRTSWPEGNYLLPAAALLVWNEPYWSVIPGPSHNRPRKRRARSKQPPAGGQMNFR